MTDRCYLTIEALRFLALPDTNADAPHTDQKVCVRGFLLEQSRALCVLSISYRRRVRGMTNIHEMLSGL